MSAPSSDSAKPLSQKARASWSRIWPARSSRLEQEVERLRLDNSNLRLDNQALKDEIALRGHTPHSALSAPGIIAIERSRLLRQLAPSRRVFDRGGGSHVGDTLGIAPCRECFRQGIGGIKCDCMLSQSKPLRYGFCIV